MADPATSVVLDPSSFSYVVGIDLGSEACCFTVLTPQKQVVIKPRGFASAQATDPVGVSVMRVVQRRQALALSPVQ